MPRRKDPLEEREVTVLSLPAIDRASTRGLPCNACNTALGALEERPERFLATVSSLRRYAG
jgi:hypothetical protein